MTWRRGARVIADTVRPISLPAVHQKIVPNVFPVLGALRTMGVKVTVSSERLAAELALMWPIDAFVRKQGECIAVAKFQCDVTQSVGRQLRKRRKARRYVGPCPRDVSSQPPSA